MLLAVPAASSNSLEATHNWPWESTSTWDEESGSGTSSQVAVVVGRVCWCWALPALVTPAQLLTAEPTQKLEDLSIVTFTSWFFFLELSED